MRVVGIPAGEAALPNALIASCPDRGAKARVLAELNASWGRAAHRLALYDGEALLGIAFADADGHVTAIASPQDMSAAAPTITKFLAAHLSAVASSSAGGGSPSPADGPHEAPRGAASGDVAGDAAGCGHGADSRPRRRPWRAVAAVAIALSLLSAAAAAAWILGLLPREASEAVGLPDPPLSARTGTPSKDVPAPAPTVAPDQTASVTVERGDSASAVRDRLAAAGLADAASGLLAELSATGGESSVRPGTYLVKGSETAGDVARRLTSGQLFPDGTLGVDNGTTLRAMAAKVDAGRFPFTGSQLLEAASRPGDYRAAYPMMAAVPDGLPSVEGFIPAGTYDLSGARDAGEAVRTMLDAGEARFEASGASPEEWLRWLTVASLLDREVMHDEERPVVASVIDNRLEAGMPLQVDAAVLYALGRDGGIPTLSDLEVDSPYNTYRHKGLPPGPISSGVTGTSLSAAREHPRTAYLYYCLAPEGDGHHRFTASGEEHMRNVADFEAATGRR